MNILVLMAGSSEKFYQAGYLYPKPFIEIDGIPLLERLLSNLSVFDEDENQLIFAIQDQENQRFHTESVIKLLRPDSKIIKVPENTSGAVCTALMAIELINNQTPLLVYNGDIIVTTNIANAVKTFREEGIDGGVIVFKGLHPRWSYVRCNSKNEVIEATEKRPISMLATAGIYYYAKGHEFVAAAMEMIIKDAHVDNQFYICPTYNEMILKQKRIVTHEIQKESYFSLSTPQGLIKYEAYLSHQKAVSCK